ncbi:hypothetical protein BH11ACT8_BH11ACT8_11830 [soil metagenome]
MYLVEGSVSVKCVSEENSRTEAPADQGVYAISIAAQLVSMEIQNLRVYERRGLVAPDRSAGGSRLYSSADIERLRRVGELLGDGLNLAGVARVVALEDEVKRLRAELQHTEE